MKKFIKYAIFLGSLFVLIGLLTRKVSFGISGDDSNKDTYVFTFFYQKNDISSKSKKSADGEEVNALKE